MSVQKSVVALIVFSAVIFWFSVPRRENRARVLVSKAYSPSATKNEVARNLREAREIACEMSPELECSRDLDESVVSTLLFVDDYYLDSPNPLHVITSTAQLPASGFSLGGSSEVNRETFLKGRTGDAVTLFGSGSLDARVFLLADGRKYWTISVTALHDDPAPVVLEIWLDDELLGTLNYDKGDQSWETLSLGSMLSPNYHSLRIRFANDYIDPEQGLDRNAYIAEVIASQ